MSISLNTLQTKIIIFLYFNEPKTTTTIAKKLLPSEGRKETKNSDRKVRYNLNKMKENNIVEEKEEDGKKKYTIDEDRVTVGDAIVELESIKDGEFSINMGKIIAIASKEEKEVQIINIPDFDVIEELNVM